MDAMIIVRNGTRAEDFAAKLASPGRRWQMWSLDLEDFVGCYLANQCRLANSIRCYAGQIESDWPHFSHLKIRATPKPSSHQSSPHRDKTGGGVPRPCVQKRASTKNRRPLGASVDDVTDWSPRARNRQFLWIAHAIGTRRYSTFA